MRISSVVAVVLVACGSGRGGVEPAAGVDASSTTRDAGEDARVVPLDGGMDAGPPGSDSAVSFDASAGEDSAAAPGDAGPDCGESIFACSSDPPPCRVGDPCGLGRVCCGDPVECLDLSLDQENCGACGRDCMGDPTTDTCVSGNCRCGDAAPCVASTEECCDGVCAARGSCSREPYRCREDEIACVDHLWVDWICMPWGTCPRICGICDDPLQCCESVVDGERDQGCGPLGQAACEE